MLLIDRSNVPLLMRFLPALTDRGCRFKLVLLKGLKSGPVTKIGAALYGLFYKEIVFSIYAKQSHYNKERP